MDLSFFDLSDYGHIVKVVSIVNIVYFTPKLYNTFEHTTYWILNLYFEISSNLFNIQHIIFIVYFLKQIIYVKCKAFHFQSHSKLKSILIHIEDHWKETPRARQAVTPRLSYSWTRPWVWGRCCRRGAARCAAPRSTPAHPPGEHSKYFQYVHHIFL